MEKQQSFQSILRQKLENQRASASEKRTHFDPTLLNTIENQLPFHQIRGLNLDRKNLGHEEYSRWQQFSRSTSNHKHSPQEEAAQAHYADHTTVSESHSADIKVQEEPLPLFTEADLYQEEQVALRRLIAMGAPLALQGFSENDVIKSYRHLAKSLHPDASPEASQAESQALAHQFHDMRECVNRLKTAISRLSPMNLAQAA